MGITRITAGSIRRGAAALVLMMLVAAPLLAGCEDAQSSPEPSLAALDVAIDTLRGGTRSERQAAADDLAELGDPEAVPALATALADESWDVRWRAAEALAKVHDERAVEPLLQLIAAAPESPPVDDADMWAAQEAYKAAITALGAIGDVRAVPRLVEIAAVETWTLDAGAAEDALGAIGAPAVDGIAEALAAADAATGARILPLLASLGDAGFDKVAAALGDKRAAVRVAAAEALGEFGKGAVAPLLSALESGDRNVRAAAARSLGKIGDTRATAGLVGLLADSKTAAAATTALADIHREDAAPLLKYLKAKKSVGVYRVLIRIGQGDTVPALVTALKAFGTKTMGETYLNCGNATLERAARTWAKQHGYTVVTRPGAGEERWGG